MSQTIASNGVVRRLHVMWQVIEFGSPFVFALVILAIGLRGEVFAPLPETVEGAVKLTSWLSAISFVYMFVQGLTAGTQSGSRYFGRAADIALSVVPALALAAVMVLFWWDEEVTLNVVQRKFLWSAGWAVLFDMVVCTIIAFRIAMRSIGFGQDN